ncbi:MAG TPA: hypothetical protein VG713_13660 [Pirellulales bacterium]|nr:hypothetical protein [Pirellulales bacterium]
MSELIGEAVPAEEISETILIRDGKYRGRSYRTGDYMAMWLFESGLVMFYDRRGELLRTCELCTPAAATRRAA